MLQLIQSAQQDLPGPDGELHSELDSFDVVVAESAEGATRVVADLVELCEEAFDDADSLPPESAAMRPVVHSIDFVFENPL